MNRMRRIGGNESLRKNDSFRSDRYGCPKLLLFLHDLAESHRLRSFSRTSYRYSQYEYSDLQTKSDLFLPLYLTWIHQDEVKETNSETLIRDVQGLLSDAQVNDLTVQNYDSKSFSEAATLDEGVTLAYYTPFLLNDYAETFDVELALGDNEANKMAFSHIQIDLKENKIQFVNLEELRIIEGKIDWDKNDVNRILKDNPREWTAMRQEESGKSNQFYTQDTIKLKKYSYVSSLQSANLFREAFFTSPKDVKVNDDSVDTYYYEGGQNMAVLHDDQVVKFETTVSEK